MLKRSGTEKAPDKGPLAGSSLMTIVCVGSFSAKRCAKETRGNSRVATRASPAGARSAKATYSTAVRVRTCQYHQPWPGRGAPARTRKTSYACLNIPLGQCAEPYSLFSFALFLSGRCRFRPLPVQYSTVCSHCRSTRHQRSAVGGDVHAVWLPMPVVQDVV